MFCGPLKIGPVADVDRRCEGKGAAKEVAVRGDDADPRVAGVVLIDPGQERIALLRANQQQIPEASKHLQQSMRRLNDDLLLKRNQMNHLLGFAFGLSGRRVAHFQPGHSD